MEDTWAYDVRSHTWREINAQTHPVNTAGATAAYDSESDRIVFYFPTRLDDSAPQGLTRTSETWAFDPSNLTWTDMRPDSAPFGLMGSRMAYDAVADRVVLFGGADFTLESSPRFDETWVYDYNTNTWTRRNPDTRPPGRSYFGMAYDAAARRSLIFGGSFAPDAGASADELWAYDSAGDAWERIDYDGDIRSDHHPYMVYAPGLDRTLYLVGESFWSFDHSTRSWTPLPYDPALGVRHFHAMAFDEQAQRLVLFGGGPRGLRYDNAMWTFDPAANSWTRSGPGQ